MSARRALDNGTGDSMVAPTASRTSRRFHALRALGAGLLAFALVGLVPGAASADPVGTITEHPLPTAGSSPQGIATGPDGNLWFTETSGNAIGRITPGGVISEFPLPVAASAPLGIVAGPDGNLWFTEGADRIGRITTGGVISEFPLLGGPDNPAGITVGPDGNLWFTEFGGDRVGKITTGGLITEYPLPTAGSAPVTIVAGPDGNLWFTEFLGNRLGRITPGGVITELTMPNAGSRPNYIIVGPDSKLWFTEQTGTRIARINADAGMTGLVEFPIASGALPDGISVGCDGNLWFAEAFGNAIGRIAPDGSGYTEFPLPNAKSGPIEIVSGPDQNLWFTEGVSMLVGINGNRIGKIGAGCGDVMPPVLTLPGNITVLATSPAGAPVTYTVTATDAGSPPATVSCVPPSGATFAIGTTPVNCTATDGANNVATGSFALNVVGAPGQIGLTILTVESFHTSPPVERGLIALLRVANDALARGRPGVACVSLAGFITLSQASSVLGRPLTRAQGAQLLADARQIRAVIGC